jgi:hypothetical protein
MVEPHAEDVVQLISPDVLARDDFVGFLRLMLGKISSMWEPKTLVLFDFRSWMHFRCYIMKHEYKLNPQGGQKTE